MVNPMQRKIQVPQLAVFQAHGMMQGQIPELEAVVIQITLSQLQVGHQVRQMEVAHYSRLAADRRQRRVLIPVSNQWMPSQGIYYNLIMDIKNYMNEGKNMVIELDNEIEYLIDEVAEKDILKNKNKIKLTRLIDREHFFVEKKLIEKAIQKKGIIDYLDRE
jgi:hypothetical protein